MRRLLPLLMLGFGVGLAVMVGQRMSADAMSVVIGVAVGVAASVPTSLLLVALLRRERGGGYRQDYREMPNQQQLPFPQQPTIVVLDPAQYAASMRAQQPGGYPLPPPDYVGGTNGAQPGLPRVVGGDEW